MNLLSERADVDRNDRAALPDLHLSFGPQSEATSDSQPLAELRRVRVRGHVGHDERRVRGERPHFDAPEKLRPLSPSPKPPRLRWPGAGESFSPAEEPNQNPKAGQVQWFHRTPVAVSALNNPPVRQMPGLRSSAGRRDSWWFPPGFGVPSSFCRSSQPGVFL